MSSPVSKVSDGTLDLTFAASGTADTPILPVKNRRLSIDASWTGTPTGVFKLQCSFDSGTTWRDVPGAAAEFTANGNLQPAASASNAVWNFVNVPGGAWRIRYTATSGTGAGVLRFAWGN